MKKKCKFIVGILAFALFIGGGGLLINSFYNKKQEDVLSSSFNAAYSTGELWDNTKFNATRLQKLFDKISGRNNVGFGKLLEMAKSKITSDKMSTNAGGEISIMLGGLEWTPTYLSTTSDGEIILTLWMSRNEQNAFKGYESKTEKAGKYYGFVKHPETGKTGLYSDWAADWAKDNPTETYPANMYGTSYIRTVTLNNGGKYAISGTETVDFEKDENSVFAKFTMPGVEGSLYDYIVEPARVTWQEEGQDFSLPYSGPNENWSPNIPNTGGYNGVDYAFRPKNGVYYNYADKGEDNSVWKDDKLWLPSASETKRSSVSGAIWVVTNNQCDANNAKNIEMSSATGSLGSENKQYIDKAYSYSWLRMGYYYSANLASVRTSDSTNSESVVDSYAVRPALHLDIKKAAINAGIEISYEDYDYNAPIKISELWTGTSASFDQTNLQNLFNKISGKTNIDFVSLRSMGQTTITATDMITNAGGEISVRLGGLDWTPTYLSTDNDKNTILTLWLNRNAQDVFYNRATNEGKYHGFIYSSTTRSTGLYSDWSANYSGNNPSMTYPSNMYGTSYIRSVTLNNGGEYAISETDLTADSGQDKNSIFAKFTMKSVSDLTNYLVTPSKVSWQEYQNAQSQLSMPYIYPNEGYQLNQSNDGYVTYSNYSTKDKYDTWRNDKLWLPSLTEVGSSDTKVGLWNTSLMQRKNYDGSSVSFTTDSQIGTENSADDKTAYTYSWLRSGDDSSNEAVFALNPSGNVDFCDTISADVSCAVRPALHLNLDAAAKSAGIQVPEFTWTDFAAEKFDNEDTADGSKEHPYEIATADQLARLAYLVNEGTMFAMCYYKQTADINLRQHYWTPIGVGSLPFMGIYDGSGYNIDGLQIDMTKQTVYSSDCGLFGSVTNMLSLGLEMGGFPEGFELPKESGVVKNVTIRNGKIIYNNKASSSGGQSCGSIVGICNYGKILNCKNYIDITLAADSGGTVGGIVGQAQYSEIKDCVNYGDILDGAGIAGAYISGTSVPAFDTEGLDPDELEQVEIYLSLLRSLIDESLTMSRCVNYGNCAVGLVEMTATMGMETIISDCVVFGDISSAAFAAYTIAADSSSGSIKFTNCSAHCSMVYPEGFEEDQNEYLIVGLFVGANGMMSSVDPMLSLINCSFEGIFINAEPDMISRFAGRMEVLSGGFDATIDSCYAIINGQKFYSNGDFSGWTVSEKFNNGLPVQKEPYWSLQFAPSINEEYFSGWTKRTV